MQFRLCFCVLLIIFLAAPFASAEWMVTNYYTLDETTGTTAYDSVGTYNGTLTTIGETGSFTFDDASVTGTVGNALEFTGNDNQLVSLGDDVLTVGTDDFKISMWIKRSSIGTYQGLWGQHSLDEGADHSMWARIQDTNVVRLCIDMGTGTGASLNITSLTPITDTTSWHQLEFERTYSAENDETTYAIYLDGSFDGSAVHSGIPYDISGDDGTVLGSYTPTTDRTFNGLIDDVKIYANVVPEPSTIILMGFGLLGLLGLRLRRFV